MPSGSARSITTQSNVGAASCIERSAIVPTATISTVVALQQRADALAHRRVVLDHQHAPHALLPNALRAGGSRPRACSRALGLSV